MEKQGKAEALEISLLELLQMIVRRKFLVVKVCAVFALVAVGLSLLLPNIYSATARVLPPQKDAGGLSALLGQMGGLASLAGSLGGLGGGSDLYVGILKSRSVADAVIKRADLVNVYKSKTVDETRKILEKKVKIQGGKDGIISIVAEDKDPKRAALLANAFVDELGKTTVRLNLTKAGTERMFLERRLEVVKKDLKEAEEELKAFSQSNKVIAVDAQAKATIEGIARLKAELASKEVQLSVLSEKLTAQSPEVQAAQVGINRLKSEIGRLAGNGGNTMGIPSVGNVPSVALDYMRRMRELKTQEAVFEQLTKQYELAKLSEAKDSSTMQVLDEAIVPVRKSKPTRSLIVIVSVVAGFFVSLFYIFMSEWLNKMPDQDRNLIANIKKEALRIRKLEA